MHVEEQYAQLAHQKQQSQFLARVAYFAMVIWVVRLLSFFIKAIRDATPATSPVLSEVFCILGIATHLILFPIIDALPAPRWAKAAGYGWLVIDVATQIMQLNNVDNVTYLAMKYGGHISAAVWIIAASWQRRGALRIVGLLLAIVLGGYSFIAPFDPTKFLGLLPSLVLLPVWLILIGRFFVREDLQA